MNKGYNPKEIESKWQKYWYDSKVFSAQVDQNKKKFYGLIEFPYPSGAGMHVGHIRAYSGMEVLARKKRLEGYNVLFPIGYDAFGLPTENYAMSIKTHPRIVTDRNIKRFNEQLRSVGFSFDFDRVIDTTDPDYYRWTQWIFIQLFKNGLAYKSKTLVNFCPDCKVVLANEESQDGVCDRCGSAVVQKEKDVWFLRIRNYAERLLQGLEKVDFLDRIKIEQSNWIGRSEGAELTFTVTGGDITYPLNVYTTRPDTLYGATFLVISPEHPMVKRFEDIITNYDKVREYQKQALMKKELERTQLNKEKTGLKVEGIFATNPITNEPIPVFMADYVMMDYGTGAIMAVPAHDTRDYQFAKKYNLPIVEVIKGGDIEKEAYIAKDGGTMINSGILNGMEVEEAIVTMIKHLEKLGIGKAKVDYKMKDWAFNRQRYWGEPIPIINCAKCGQVPVPESELPLVLPDLEDFSPTDDASSPLSKCTDWVNTTCPKCGGSATRETDTMPQWAGSSWYFLRYLSPKCQTALVDPDDYKYWGQVDWYNGGMEHVTRHLIYSRFWNMFLYDIGVVTYQEPYLKRTTQGLILGSDGEKMSKSRGNVVNPDDVIRDYGADVLRTFILFMGDFEKPAPWSEDGAKGCWRFLNRVWNLMYMIKETKTDDINLAFAIKKVSDDYESNKFNTAIAQLMSTLNQFYQRTTVTKDELNVFLKLLYPVASHIASEMYEKINNGAKIEKSTWPTYDEKDLIAQEIEIPVQINGKLKGKVLVEKDATQERVLELVKTTTNALEDKTIIKVIYVKDRIINIIAK
ncbi:MAG: leucine--tRNA ligase [Clostridiales bacterium]|nr:leucine--tRNA ligase [Clostridiales bacterium]